MPSLTVSALTRWQCLIPGSFSLQRPFFSRQLSSYRQIKSSELELRKAQNEKLTAATIRIVTALRNNDLRTVRASFPWFFRFFTTERWLAKLWKSVTYAVGDLESWGSTHMDNTPSSPELSSPLPKTNTLLNFRRCNLGLQIKFNKEATKIRSLDLNAPIRFPHLAPAWTAPEYVEEGSFTEHAILVRDGMLWPKIKGSLSLPSTPGPHPAVLLIPGSGFADLDLSMGGLKPFKDLAYGIASNGVAVLRIEKPVIKCLYKLFVTRNVTPEDEYISHNVKCLELLSKYPCIDPARIFTVGASGGGRYTPRLGVRAKRRGIKLAGMVSLAGAPGNLLAMVKYQLNYFQTHFPRKDTVQFNRDIRAIEALDELIHRPGFTPHWWTKNPTTTIPIPCPLKYFVDDARPDLDPVRLASGLETPMLFLQGGEDWQVRPKEEFEYGFRRGLQHMKNVEFKLYEGLNHCFMRSEGRGRGLKQYDGTGHVEPEVVEDVVRWIKER